jgi:hypothetical protein
VHAQGAVERLHRTEQALLQVRHHQQLCGPLLAAGPPEALFPARSVLLQQLGQFQLRGFGGQAIEHHRHHVALG